MKKLIIGLFVLGLTIPLFAQVINLPEVEIKAVNYKYLSAVGSNIEDVNIQMLQEKVATYDIKKSEMYSDEYDTYSVMFYIPNGRIVAAYDDKGNLIRTIERFKDVKLPLAVRNKVYQKFPNWAFVNDVYRVNYHNKKGVTKKQYKIKLTNAGEVMRIKVDEDGDIM